jgi:hypothetical protein
VTLSHIHHRDRHFLSPTNALGPHNVVPSYPSSTLHCYYPLPHHAANYAHISPSQTYHSHSHTEGRLPLPSASQSHIPSLRHTPSIPSSENIRIKHVPVSSSPGQQDNTNSHNSQCIHSHSPVTFYQPQPIPAFTASQHIPLPYNSVFPTHASLPQPHAVRTNPNHSNSEISYITSTLPSTKDVPLFTGKHDWGPWHSAVRTLSLNSNLLGHVADDPLPRAAFDPGLWPTYPPTVHQRSTHAEIQSFTTWWSRDGLTSHILMSRLSSSVLSSLPIPNERMGQRRSARSVYLTLHHQYGAGDYSAVMLIEAHLHRLRCLPTRGGVCILEFISTWCISINQMEAAGFLLGTRQLLSIFAEGFRITQLLLSICMTALFPH